MNTEEKLRLLLQTKTNLKNSINNKGGTITDDTPFDEYPTQIDNISIGGGGIIEVDELPTPSAETVGKAYKYQGTLFEGTASKTFKLYDRLGNSIFFDTSFDASIFLFASNFSATDIIATDNISISIIEAFSLMGVSEMGKCIGVVAVDIATQMPISFLYVICDVLSVELFNQYIGSQFGLTISQFGWQTDTFNTGIYANDYITKTNTDADIIISRKETYYRFESKWDDICYKNEPIMNIPDTVYKIDDYAFSYNGNLTHITIPNSVISIGQQAFESCYSLKSIAIPNSVTTIEWGTFQNCKSLKSVTIGKGVTHIKDSAFIFCDAITDVYYRGTEEEWSAIKIEYFNTSLTNATIHFNYEG